MDILVVIKILIATVVLLYLSGLFLVLIYEKRKISSYKNAKNKIELIENSKISMAVLHAKMFKVKQDYLSSVAEIDRKQQFIFEKVLLIRRSTLKTKYRKNCLAVLL